MHIAKAETRQRIDLLTKSAKAVFHISPTNCLKYWGLVSEETVVLCRWWSDALKFGL